MDRCAIFTSQDPTFDRESLDFERLLQSERVQAHFNFLLAGCYFKPEEKYNLWNTKNRRIGEGGWEREREREGAERKV